MKHETRVNKWRYIYRILISYWDSRDFLSALATDSSRQLDVLWHDCDALGVNRAQVGVFEEADQVCFGSFLESADCCGLKTQVCLEILCDFTDQTLERQFSDQQLRGLLVSSDFTKSYGSWPEINEILLFSFTHQ